MGAVPGDLGTSSSAPRFCPNCGAPVSASANFCSRCGMATSTAGRSAVGPPYSAPLPPPTPWPRVSPLYLPNLQAADRDRTVTGLLLLVIGFAISWIPYVGTIGGLLALVGIIFVFLGRRGYGEAHHRYVVVGGVLYVLTLFAGIILGVSFVLGLISQVPPAGTSLSAFGAALTSDLEWLFVGAAVLGILGSLSQVIMVYALADRATRILLWLGFLSGVVTSIVILLILWPEVATAVSQATSGTSFNSGPISQIETTSDILGLIKIAPSLLFAWAYYRCREHAMNPPGGPTPSVPRALGG